MSARREGRWTSMGLRPRAEKLSRQGDAGMEFMQPFAHGVARPAQGQGGSPLAQAECLDSPSHEAPALGAVEGTRGLRQPRTHLRAQFHGATSLRGSSHCTKIQQTIYFLESALD